MPNTMTAKLISSQGNTRETNDVTAMCFKKSIKEEGKYIKCCIKTDLDMQTK